MEPKPSLLEVATDALRKAEAAFADNPGDDSNRRVTQARQLVASEKDRERRNGGPIRPPS
jgi:hypothetical protein